MNMHSSFRCSAHFALGFTLLFACAAQLNAQNELGWTTPFPGHRVIADLYAVGTYDLGVFLITSEQGHILINTGLEDSTPLIRENIELVGYRLEDIEILLTMQAHWDHTAAWQRSWRLRVPRCGLLLAMPGCWKTVASVILTLVADSHSGLLKWTGSSVRVRSSS